MALLITGLLLLFRRPLELAPPEIQLLGRLHLAGACVFVCGPILAWLIGDTAAGWQWIVACIDGTVISEATSVMCALSRATTPSLSAIHDVKQPVLGTSPMMLWYLTHGGR